MKISSKTCAVTILAGALLLIATMILHPVGGNIDHLREITQLAVISHSLAIVSIPVLLFGLYGFSKRISHPISVFALIVFGIAAFAAVVAAALNGLVLPSFLSRYPDPNPDQLELLRMILVYNSTVNHAFDWILISGFALSIMFWSVGIMITKYLPTWFAGFGIFTGILGLYSMLSGSLGLSLHDFRFFMFGFALWTLLLVILLWIKGD